MTNLKDWTTESSPGKQLLMSIGVTLVGIVLMMGFHDFSGPNHENAFAGFMLGLLLLVIGASSLIFTGKESISVRPDKRQIDILSRSPFGKKHKTIAFSEIESLGVSELGKRSNHTVSYFVSLKLTNGKHFPLFFPAYYEGRWERQVALERCRKLEGYLNSDKGRS